MATTVADVMVRTLRASGVRRVYGLPGDSLNGFTDALRRDRTIAWQHVRHEEAAAFAAAAEAALTGQLAVCAGSCGPGNLHLINGLFDANRSGVPVLAIAAQIPAAEIGGEYFQETHPAELFRECSVYRELVSVPEQLPRILEIAMRTALARGGVAVIVVPGETFLAHAPGDAEPLPVRALSPVMRPDEASLAAAAEVLNATRQVTILAGAGCAGAHDQLIGLAAALKAPVVHAFRGKEFVEYDNPYDVGMTGLIGFSSGYRAMEHCDALVMLGTDFPYRPFYPEGVPVIQVDVRGERIGRRVPLAGTVRDTVDALLPLIEVKADTRHLDLMTGHYRRARARLDKLARDRRHASPLHPQSVAATIDRLADADAIFTADVGTPCIWAARYLRMNGTRRLIGSFNHGSMANALPHAIGAQAAHPGRQVVALSGDGGLAMLLGELITLRQLRLPVKVVVFNNGALSFVELEMKAAGIVTYGTDLDNPGDYVSFDFPSPYQLGTAKAEVFAEGSWGGTFHDDFQPRPGDVVAREHWGSSGFASTDLDLQLKQHGIRRIILTGLIANTCIEATGRFGMELGYHVTLVKDATAAFSQEGMRAAHVINGPTYAHAILTTRELLAELSA